MNGAGIVSSPNDVVGTWLLGVDALAVDPDGKKLVVGGAGISVFDTKVAVVNLAELAVTVLDTGVVAPAGFAIVPGKNVFLDEFNCGNAKASSGADSAREGRTERTTPGSVESAMTGGSLGGAGGSTSRSCW